MPSQFRFLPFALLALLVVCFPLSASPWGVCSHLLRPHQLSNIDTVLRRTNDAGITWLRGDIQFSRVMRGGLSTPDFSDIDKILEKLDAANVQMLAVLQGYDWEVERHRSEFVPLYDRPEAWRTFVRAVASHYKGRISHYEIWNEQDGGFWKPHPNASQYVNLLKIAYTEIKKIDPAATVMVGGLVYWNTAYLRDMYAAGAQGHFDMIAVHPYGQGLDQNPLLQKHMVEFKNLLTRHGDQNIPIWISECGAASNEPTILYKNDSLIPNAIRYALAQIHKKPVSATSTQSGDLPSIGFALSPRTHENPDDPVIRSWLPNVPITPLTLSQLASLDPQKVPVLIGSERLHIDEPLLKPLQKYVEQGGLLILAGQVPLFGVYQQRSDGTWTPAIDKAKETQSLFRISFSAWWMDKNVPQGTTRVRTTKDALAGGVPSIDHSYVDRVLRSDRLQSGDTYHPLVSAYNSKGTAIGEAMALYTYGDKKGGVLAICTPAGGQFTETSQAALLPRVYLTYLAAGMNIQKLFWYDLHNDGPMPFEAEHNFGLLRWDWSPKPAWHSYRAMTTALGSNPVFIRRIQLDATLSEKAWALLFRRSEDNQHVLAAWTADPAVPFSLYTSDHRDALADIASDTVCYFPITAEAISTLRIAL